MKAVKFCLVADSEFNAKCISLFLSYPSKVEVNKIPSALQAPSKKLPLGVNSSQADPKLA